MPLALSESSLAWYSSLRRCFSSSNFFYFSSLTLRLASFSALTALGTMISSLGFLVCSIMVYTRSSYFLEGADISTATVLPLYFYPLSASIAFLASSLFENSINPKPLLRLFSFLRGTVTAKIVPNFAKSFFRCVSLKSNPKLRTITFPSLL